MPEAGDFPTRNSIFREHWRQHQVQNIWLGRAEAARRREDRHVVLVAEEHQVAGLDWREKALDMRAQTHHGATYDILRTSRRGSRGDQDAGGLGTEQML